MNPSLEQELNQLAEQEQWQTIVERIESIPEGEREWALIGRYVRALNNSDQAQRAIEVSLQHQEQGQEDALWHYRLGYAYWYLDRFGEAAAMLSRGRALAADDPETMGWIDELLSDIDEAKNREAPMAKCVTQQSMNQWTPGLNQKSTDLPDKTIL